MDGCWRMYGHRSCIALTTVFLLFGHVGGLNEGEKCLTPERGDGKCIQLRGCKYYSSRLTKPVPKEVLELLKKARCDTTETSPLFCCPIDEMQPKPTEGKRENKCRTASGDDGNCITKNDCPLFSTSAASPVVLELLQKSRCGEDSQREMYCCPSQKDKGDWDDQTNHRHIGLLDRGNCGPVMNVNIIHANGSRSGQYAFPWAALIAYSGTTDPAVFRCVGSLISKRYVITAAHCLKYIRGNVRPVSVRLGDLNLETSLDCTEDECIPPPQDIGIERIIIHPQYKGWPNYEHDLALLRLEKDANLNSIYVRPVCLPIGMPHETKDLVREELLVSGWCSYENKKVPVLLQKKVKGLSHEECVLLLKKELPISSSSQFCTTSDNYSDCQGYGGSPLVKYENAHQTDVAIQYGITSFGPKYCSNPDIPTVYTRLSHYSKWILDHMEQ